MKVTVCKECMQASCWQGLFMCDRSRSADIVEVEISKLQEMALEHPDYWKSDDEATP